LSIDERIFGAKINSPLIHESTVMQLASMRQGTASTKTRGEVRGGGRKPWKQKGTGRARHGSNRSPIWRGGGVTFGPRPRDYGYSIPRKKYRTALRSALAAKFRDGEIIVLDELPLGQGKTKSFAKVLKNLGLSKRILLVVGELSKELELSTRNVRNVRLLLPGGLNVYDVVSHAHVVMTRQALDRIGEVWS
jgi:large subunit ribosomal protein L4